MVLGPRKIFSLRESALRTSVSLTNSATWTSVTGGRIFGATGIEAAGLAVASAAGLEDVASAAAAAAGFAAGLVDGSPLGAPPR